MRKDPGIWRASHHYFLLPSLDFPFFPMWFRRWWVDGRERSRPDLAGPGRWMTGKERSQTRIEYQRSGGASASQPNLKSTGRNPKITGRKRAVGVFVAPAARLS